MHDCSNQSIRSLLYHTTLRVLGVSQINSTNTHGNRVVNRIFISSYRRCERRDALPLLSALLCPRIRLIVS